MLTNLLLHFLFTLLWSIFPKTRYFHGCLIYHWFSSDQKSEALKSFAAWIKEEMNECMNRKCDNTENEPHKSWNITQSAYLVTLWRLYFSIKAKKYSALTSKRYAVVPEHPSLPIATVPWHMPLWWPIRVVLLLHYYNEIPSAGSFCRKEVYLAYRF